MWNNTKFMSPIKFLNSWNNRRMWCVFWLLVDANNDAHAQIMTVMTFHAQNDAFWFQMTLFWFHAQTMTFLGSMLKMTVSKKWMEIIGTLPNFAILRIIIRNKHNKFHMEQTSLSKPFDLRYKCPICYNLFSTKHSLRQHRYCYHSIMSSNVPYTAVPAPVIAIQITKKDLDTKIKAIDSNAKMLIQVSNNGNQSGFLDQESYSITRSIQVFGGSA